MKERTWRNLKKFSLFTAAAVLTLLFVFSASAQSARQRQLLDSGWRFHLHELDGSDYLTVTQAQGVSVTQWVYTNDDNAFNADGSSDASTMAAPGLNTSSWTSLTIQPGVFVSVFGGTPGAAWFRANVNGSAFSVAPTHLHFDEVDDNAAVYLNGVLVGQHFGWDESDEFPIPTNLWITSGNNVIAVADNNMSGQGGVQASVYLMSVPYANLVQTNDLAPANSNYNDSAWSTVQLPNDYIIGGTFTNTADASHGSLPMYTAWYRKSFTLQATPGQSVWLDFDGVYRHAMVWINGNFLGAWSSGYAPFRYDITPYVVSGTNELAVHVDATHEEGWWYEGGGIYRHVWLNIANSLHIAPCGTYVTNLVYGPDTNGNASAELGIITTITNASSQSQTCTLTSQVVGPNLVSVGTAQTSVSIAAGTVTNVVQYLYVTNALLWSLEMPQLYQLQSSLQQNSATIDNVNTAFGIRSIYYDVNNGLFVNGKPVKIKGVCNHQDFAGVGTGLPDNLLYWRVMKLKQAGANAWRTSHNPPTPALLDACDQLGMLVMDENRHLGDTIESKSPVGVPYCNWSELDNMILRDRNHPSVIMWSMCNEEFILDGTQEGQTVFSAMMMNVQQLDTTRPITCAINGDNFDIPGITAVEDLEGFNYNPDNYGSFHAEFPTMPMFASETTSATEDRGEYTNDGVAYCTSYDTTTEDSWQPVAARAFMAGGFVWTGFDYKGEPTPYGWPCVNSKFGFMDLCGVPKDDYYFYQAWWDTKPFVYIFPMNWNSLANNQSVSGNTVSVWCYGNTASVELFLNGVSQGAQAMPAYGHVAWTVPYASGTLLVKGYDANGTTVASNQVVTTGPPAAISLTTDRTTLAADNEDVTVVYASIVDSQGRVVPTATNYVTFSVQGAGYVAGVGNGDPACHEPDRGTQRNAFNGWCMALVGATNSPGAIMLTATSPGLLSATNCFQSLATNSAPATPTNLVVLAGNNQVQLSWTISFGAIYYNIERAISSGGPYTMIASYTTDTYTDTGVTNGTTYYYVVSAVSTNGESANSTQMSATPGTSPPAPTGLSASISTSQINLSWNASSGATSYNVKWATTSGGPYTTIFSPATPGYVDRGLADGMTYYYVVSAVNTNGESANSAQVSATPTPAGLVVPNGTYEIVDEPGYALDDPNGGGAGTGVDQTYYSETNQQWTITLVSGTQYEITAANGLALTGTNIESQLIVTNYTGASNQLWVFQNNGSYTNIINVATGDAMDDWGGGSGQVVGEWDASPDNANQNWTLTAVTPGSPPSTIPNGIYEIVDEPGYALDDPDGGGAKTGVDQVTYGGTDQQWVIAQAGNGQYEILSVTNGLALTGTNIESQLIVTNYTGAKNQLWTFTPNGADYNIGNVGSGENMDDWGGGSGTIVGQWPASTTNPNQQWTLRAVSPPPIAMSSAMVNGQFSLKFTNGVTGLNYVVETSTNLTTGNWVPIYTNTPSGGVFVFTNTNTVISPRFYRIVQY